MPISWGAWGFNGSAYMAYMECLGIVSFMVRDPTLRPFAPSVRPGPVRLGRPAVSPSSPAAATTVIPARLASDAAEVGWKVGWRLWGVFEVIGILSGLLRHLWFIFYLFQDGFTATIRAGEVC